MRTIYLRKDENNISRKILIDMAYLVSNNKIRLPKYYYEDNLYIPYHKLGSDNGVVEKYFLTKDKIISEDADFYFFKFIFKHGQVINVDD
ncbi:MAG: hypothetical protein ACYDA4_14470 [Ignavibacteriaceae bacterium]